MNTPLNQNNCPKCGVPLPADAPQGLCPKCLLLAASTPTDADTGPVTPGKSLPIENVQAAFPQLEILELIGAGGMGAVYKARQPKLDRIVALKVLAPSLAASPVFAERFNREARVLARLNHPGIVNVFDFGVVSPVAPSAQPESSSAAAPTALYFLLMEFVDGVNLRQAMQAGRFSPAQALALVPKVCEALQFAHEEGILHRDIKPENILLDSKGRVKIADFGIAKLVGEPRAVTKLTATGAAIGTPQYMAPEQIEHPEDVDLRADIYSLGVVFYEMLTGELPLGRFAPPSKKADIDERVDEIVLRALEKERELRQHSAGEVKTQVEGIGAVLPRAASPIAAQPPRTEPPRTGAASEPGDWPTVGTTKQFGLCLLLGLITLWFLLEFGPATLGMIQGPDLPFLDLGQKWHLGATVWSIFSKLAALTALLFVGNFFAWRAYARQRAAARAQQAAGVGDISSGEQAMPVELRPVSTALFLLGVMNCLPLVAVGLAYLAAVAGRTPGGQVSLSREVSVLLVPFVLGCMTGGVMIAAARMLRRMASREFAVLACALAMIPPIAPAFLIGIPVGIWCLMVLRRPEVKAAFSGQGSAAPGRNATTDQPATVRWSGKAIVAAILAGLGFFPPMLFLGIAFFLAIPVDHNFSMLNAQAQFLFGTALALLPALAGTLLGTLALADIRRAAGQLRGRRLAFCATLMWPLLLMNVLVVAGLLFLGIHLAGSRSGGIPLLLMLFPLALLAALGLDYFIAAKVWQWATGADGLPPGQRKSLVPVAVVLGVVLVFALPCLGFALMVWVPMLTKVTTNSVQPQPIEEFSPVREASMDVTTPPREFFTAAWTVTSNNVPVLGPVVINETLTPARDPGQFAVQWRVLDAASPEADGAPWEVVLVTGGTNRMVSRPPSESLPELAWALTQSRREMRFGPSIAQSFDGQIFRSEPIGEDGAGTAQARWSVRLTLKCSAPPRSGPLTRGIGAQFTVPAGQVAVFEVVTLSNGATVPLRNLGAYAIAPVERASEGTLSFTREAPGNGTDVRRRPWRLEVATASGAASSGGLDLPTELEFTSGDLEMRLGRLPDGEVVRWCGAEVKDLPPNANGLLGLRVRTLAHNLKPGMPGSTGTAGTGTNWFWASAAAQSTGQGISFKASSLPQETLVLTAIMVSNGIPVTGRELRAKLSPLSGRERSRYLVRWQTVAAQPPSATGTIWEVVVEEEETGSIAARLRPTNSPALVWKVTPYAERLTARSASHEATAFKVAQALQTAGGGNAGVADWGVNLQLQSAPPVRAASSGIDADFVLPAHQAAVFELVKKSNGVIEPVPNLAAYVVNGGAGQYKGKFLLADDTDDLDGLTALPRWKFGIIGPKGRSLLEGRAVPPLPVDWAGEIKLWTDLRPDTVALHGQVDSTSPGPAYGLRIRTHACPTASGQNIQSAGHGTNWMQAVPVSR